MQSLAKSLLFVAIGVFFASCKEQKEDKSRTCYQQYRQYIIEKEYDSSGKLYLSKSYTPDEKGKGLIPNGAEIHYYPNGNIKKWAWFNASLPSPWDGKIYKHGYMYFYYDTSGKYDTARGSACLQVLTYKKDLAIEFVKPPYINVEIAYIDMKNNIVVNRHDYEPVTTDSTYWIKLLNHVFKNGHKYLTIYYILDDKGRRIDSFSQDFGRW